MVDLWRDFWICGTRTGQQVAQLHDRYMMMIMRCGPSLRAGKTSKSSLVGPIEWLFSWMYWEKLELLPLFWRESVCCLNAVKEIWTINSWDCDIETLVSDVSTLSYNVCPLLLHQTIYIAAHHQCCPLHSCPSVWSMSLIKWCVFLFLAGWVWKVVVVPSTIRRTVKLWLRLETRCGERTSISSRQERSMLQCFV
jgi:hypothetical protein